jgi:hypothetical protein
LKNQHFMREHHHDLAEGLEHGSSKALGEAYRRRFGYDKNAVLISADFYSKALKVRNARRRHRGKRAVGFLWCFSLTILVISQVQCGSVHVPNALLTASPEQLSFGNQSVGTTSSPQMVTLSATGTGASLISSITTSGDFSQTNTCKPPNELAPNRSCSVAVVFTPSATGTRTGQLVIGEGISVQDIIGMTGTGQ